jgi:hypothetical protein
MATLKVKIQEDIILDNQDYGSKRVLEIASIDEVLKRIVTIPANTDTTIVSFKSTTGIADSGLDIEDVKYMRVTNLDSSNSVNLSLQIDTSEDNSAAANSATILLEAGKSFMMGKLDDGIAVNDDGAGLISSLNDLESILVDSSSNAVNLELFIASS